MLKITVQTLSVALILISSSVLGEDTSKPFCICPQIYEPVCGSLGNNLITYSNLCEFQCVQKDEPSLSIFSQGPCPTKEGAEDEPISLDFEEQEPPKKCLCSMEFRPVCGSDQQTYPNLCMLSCERENNPALTVASYGQCGKPGLAVDPPVISILKRGVRESKCFCTREFRPLCASNKKTYSNKCEFACAQKTIQGLQFVSEGTCESQE